MQTKTLLNVLCTAALAGAVSVGCSNVDLYEIDAPADLQERIDEIAAQKNNPSGGEDAKTDVTITKYEVGSSDLSTGWWGDWTQSFQVPVGQKLHLEIVNHTSGEGNWNNWVLAVVNAGDGAHSTDDNADYAEYFVLRSDLYGWGNGDYDGGRITSDYFDVLLADDPWALFREAMQGAAVTIELDHAADGTAYITATAVSADGTYTFTEEYNQVTSATDDIFMFLTVDSCYLEVKGAYLTSSSAGASEKTPVTITKYEVGTSDLSTGWWGDWSQSFEVPSGKVLHIEFINDGSEESNWNNWNIAVVNVGDGAHSADDNASYSEYFVFRSDMYGWGNGDYNSNMIGGDYADVIGEVDDMWAVFRQIMPGATVTVELDHAVTGFTYLTASATSADGAYTITETYNHPTPVDESVFAFLVVDNSYLQMKDAYLYPSEITEIEDSQAASIVASGYPVALEVGNEDFWGDAVAVVTFEDGSVAEAAVEDITFTVPDLGTPGTKTIVYSYSKTKLGAYGKAVAGSYTLQVTNSVTSIEASAEAYLIGGAKSVVLSPYGVKVDAVFSDGTKSPLSPSQFTVEFTDGKVVYDGVTGTYGDAFTVTYGDLTAVGDLTISASELPAQSDPVGAADFSNGWYDADAGWYISYTQDWAVASYESQSVSMKVSSDNLGNWHSPSVVLASKAHSEYALVRQDNFGWGGGYDAASIVSNWDWDVFAASIDGSQVTITVANAGDGTASIRYSVLDGAGVEHFQYYDGIAVNSDDLIFAVVCEECYLVFD